MRISRYVCAVFVVIGLGCGARRMTPVVAESPQRVGVPVGSKIGERALSFALTDANGQTVALDSYRGKPTVLVFYRGQW